MSFSFSATFWVWNEVGVEITALPDLALAVTERPMANSTVDGESLLPALQIIPGHRERKLLDIDLRLGCLPLVVPRSADGVRAILGLRLIGQDRASD